MGRDSLLAGGLSAADGLAKIECFVPAGDGFFLRYGIGDGRGGGKSNSESVFM